MHIYFITTINNITNMFGRNHRTSIRYSKTNPTAIIFCQGGQTDGNFSIFRRKLKSVRQKIKINPFQLLHIGLCMIIRIRHIIEREMDMLLTGCRLERFIPPFKRRKDIYRNRSIFHFSVLIFTEVQNLIDQAQENIYVTLNEQQHPVLVSGQRSVCQ